MLEPKITNNHLKIRTLGLAGEAAAFLPLRVFAGVAFALAGLSVLGLAGLFFPFLAAAFTGLAFFAGLAAFFAWAPRLEPLAAGFDSSATSVENVNFTFSTPIRTNTLDLMNKGQ